MLTELFKLITVTLLSINLGSELIGLCVQVLQQEEQVDKDWALSKAAAPGGPRPRRLKQKWKEAVEGAADDSLPRGAEFVAGELDKYLDRLRNRVVEDLGAAKRNVVAIYPNEYQPFQVIPSTGHSQRHPLQHTLWSPDSVVT